MYYCALPKYALTVSFVEQKYKNSDQLRSVVQETVGRGGKLGRQVGPCARGDECLLPT